MNSLLLTIHILASILLILIILLQKGKGADMGASFGGGASQAIFGGAGPATFLTKITAVIAIVFMLTSLTLAYRAGHRSFSSVMPASAPVSVEQKAVNTKPAAQAAAPQKAAGNKTSAPLKTEAKPAAAK